MTFSMSEDEYCRCRYEHAGFCVARGDETFGVKPNACGRVCETCKQPQVYGIEELLLMGQVEIAVRGKEE